MNVNEISEFEERSPGPTADRQDRIVRWIRDRIIDGRLKPGQRLPTQSQLVSQHRTTPVTVHKAMTRLASQGFIELRSRVGAFVAEFPPCSHRFALVMVSDVDDWTLQFQFNKVLARTAAKLTKTSGCDESVIGKAGRTLEVYSRVRGEHESEEDLRRLRFDVENRRLAGIIVTDRYAIEEPVLRPLIGRKGFPVVGVLGRPAPRGVSLIHLDRQTFFMMALVRLRELGCRRVGIVALDAAAEGEWLTIQRLASEVGLQTRPYWRIDVHNRYPQMAVPAVHMLSRLPESDRPDALIIADDSLVETVTKAMVDVGADATMRVVAHANFPFVTPSAIHANRLGFDSTQVLTACVDRLQSLRLGESGPDEIAVIEPRWEARPTSSALPAWDRIERVV
jgi:DNA-binding LacI/PurR family transcriptional regulator